MRWMAFLLCYNGWLALCLAMPKYFKRVRHQQAVPATRHGLRVIGWCSLAGALVVSGSIDGWSFGPVLWIGHLAVTGLALVFLLPYVPRVAATIGMLGVDVAVALGLS